MARIRSIPALLIAVAAAAGVVAGTAVSALSQDPGDFAKKWKEFTTPGEKHADLAKLAGKWDTTLRVWMVPGQPPMEQKGESSIESVLGGRFIRFHGTSKFMGQDAEFVAYLGYDTFKKHYVATYLNTMGTAILTADGMASQDGKTIQVYGKLDEFLDGTVGKNAKHVYRFLTPDRFVMETHDLDIGETNTKVVEVEYVRRK